MAASEWRRVGEVGRVGGRNAEAEERIERRRRNFMVLKGNGGGRRVRRLRPYIVFL